MKIFIKTTLFALVLSMPTLYCMEEQNREESQPKTLEDLGLPNELWAPILEDVYFDLTILNEVADIDKGITAAKEYILKCFKTISHVCKTFKDLNISQEQWTQLKEELRKFYIRHLNQRFLERHEGNEALYPKDGEWHKDAVISDNIAQFLATGIMPNDTMSDILDSGDTVDAHLKLITLLLFYGANPNLQDECGRTTLDMAALNHHPTDLNNIEIITFILQHGANPNLQDKDGKTALYWAVLNHHPINPNIEIITLLLRYSANPDVQINEITVRDLALQRGLDLNALFPKG